MSSNEKFEREFEDFLNEEDSRLGTLYRKLPQPEPDAKLDAAVRAMAHRALNPQLVATPRANGRRRPARWVPALGAAAGIVLAAGIAYRLGPSLHDDSEYARSKDVISVRQLDVPAPAAEPPLSPPPPPQREESTAAPVAQAPAGRLQDVPAQAVAPAPAPKAAELREKAEAQAAPEQRAADGGTLAKAPAPAQPAPAARAFPAEAKKTQKRPPELDAVERRQIMAAGAWQNLHERDADETARSEQKLKTRDDKAAANKAAPASATTSTRFATEPARPAAVAGSAVSTNVPSAPPPATAASAPAAALPQSPPSSAPPPDARSDAAAAAQSGAARGGRVAAEAAEKQDRAGSPQRARSNDPNASLYPEHWLANIREMLQHGRRDDALRSLGEFRRLYPDYHLPDDLRDLK